MVEDTTSQLRIWHRTGFGRRVLSSEAPYFVISPPSQADDPDAVRRQTLSDLAGV